MFDWNAIGNAALVVLATVTAFVAALWLSLVIWTFRDMRTRSRDLFAQILAAGVVAVLNIPGLLVYLILRPRETLAEAYARSLEEEALLQSIEEKPVCPGCGRATREHWQVCPYCHTKLKKVCVTCGELLQLGWNICPHCASSQLGYTTAEAPPERRRSTVRRVRRTERDAGETIHASERSHDRTALYPEEAYLADEFAPAEQRVEEVEPALYSAEPGYAPPERGNSRQTSGVSVRSDAVQFIEDDDF